MGWKLNLVVVAVVVVGMPSKVWAWSECPSPYDDATIGTSACYGICSWSGAPNNRIECYGSVNDDVFYVVEEGGEPWAYGTYDTTSFCCKPSDMGGSSGVHLRMEMDPGDDIVCLSDHNGPAGCTLVALSAQYWDGTSRIFGEGGADEIETSAESGTSHYDDVDGGHESDTIFTFNGDDDVDGGAGDDTIRGGSGDDELYGGTGNDDIAGNDGVDYIYGEADNDTLTGNDGDDFIYGGAGLDNASGGDGDDLVDGGDDDDDVYGNLGADKVCGGDDRDDVYGGGSDGDCVCGGNSGAGNNSDGFGDFLYGDGGSNDHCYGDNWDTHAAAPSCNNNTTGDCGCGC